MIRQVHVNGTTDCILPSKMEDTKKAITSEPWFHNITRAEAEALLEDSKGASILIRPSSVDENSFALSFKTEEIYHLLLHVAVDGRLIATTHRRSGIVIFADWHQYKKTIYPTFTLLNK